jgi:hypothetical protein
VNNAWLKRQGVPELAEGLVSIKELQVTLLMSLSNHSLSAGKSRVIVAM